MYNPIPDLFWMGMFLMIVATVMYANRPKRRGCATPESNLRKIKMHQQIRRMESEHVYNIRGNGVAHRSAEDYLSDPKVIDQLRRIENENNI